MDVMTIRNRALLASAIDGLTRPHKQLDSKWFYDRAGSELFEEITELPEYYPTRTEIGILTENAERLAHWVPDGSALLELGSGASRKTRILLDALPRLGAYVPVDISDEFLHHTAQLLKKDYPDLPVHPVVADFMGEITLADEDCTPVTAFFPGSTIGNLTETAAVDLLKRIRALPDIHAFILGFDLVKDRDRLIAAYDDAAGVTAAFNLNLLRRLNYEAGADFDIGGFAHEARWNEDHARIEMHLVSKRAQEVELGDKLLRFAPGETIHTENSHKYTPQSMEALANRGGWHVSELLTDSDDLFAVGILTPV